MSWPRLWCPLWNWLVEGASDAVLDPVWFENKERLSQYQAFTDRQLQSCIVKDVAATNRDRFWQRIAERKVKKARKKKAAEVVTFQRKLG